jgi:hypothetical protein
VLYAAAAKGYINSEKQWSKAMSSRVKFIGEPEGAARDRAAAARYCGFDGGRLLPDIASLLLTSP